MRIPPNLKFFLFFIIVIGVIALGVIYVPRYVPNIDKILLWVLGIVMGLAIIFTFLKPFFTFLYARADGVLAVYTDSSNKGFHVFTTHINSGGELSSHSTRDIQHYYFVLQTGKLFYKVIYTHSMEPQSGRSGWEGFDSFEKSVLPSASLKKTMLKISKHAGLPLHLEHPIATDNADHYSFEMSGRTIRLEKYENISDEGIRVVCTATGGSKPLWTKKI